MKLKLLFWLLLVGNVVLFGLSHGVFGAGNTERREPQRLTQQLRPDSLAILPANSEKLVAGVRAAAPATDAATNTPEDAPPAAQASAKPEPVVACTEVGNFSASDAQRFSTRLASLNLGDKVAQKLTQDITSHMVYISPQDGREGADRRVAELRRLGISDFYVIPDSFPNPALRAGISLGIFRTEEAAKAYVAQLISKGVRSARIIARRSGAGKQIFQIRDLTAESRASLDKIKADFPDQEIRACAA